MLLGTAVDAILATDPSAGNYNGGPEEEVRVLDPQDQRRRKLKVAGVGIPPPRPLRLLSRELLSLD